MALLSPVAAQAQVPAQELARWLADLGHAKLSEAAERKLIAIGDKAVKPLRSQLKTWSVSTPADIARCSAILRVISLIGQDAAPLAADVKKCGMDDAGQLLPQILDTLASLEPHTGDLPWRDDYFEKVQRLTPAVKAMAMGSIVRLKDRQWMRVPGNLMGLDNLSMREALAKDVFGVREIAAESLAKLGDPSAIDLLHKRLLDRDRQPVGWDQLSHNGFLVPLQDEFALRASMALTKLAPIDPRTAIGYANVALHHPHHSVRLESLQQLARLGSAATDTIPELLALAKLDDPSLAVEALKLLGMAGKDVGRHLNDIDELASNGRGTAPRLAKGLAARLRAMGCTAPTIDAQAIARAQVVRRMVDKLDSSATPEIISKLAADPAAWPLLRDRIQKSGLQAPVGTFEVIVQLAWLMPEVERTRMRYCLALIGYNHWESARMCSSSSGPERTRAQHFWNAQLLVDPRATPEQLRLLLSDQNPYIRLVALQALAKQEAEWAENREVHLAVRTALLHAATRQHPTKFQVDRSRHYKETGRADIDKELKTAAAEALVLFRIETNRISTLLNAVMRSKHEDKIVNALGNWSNQGGRPTRIMLSKLQRLADDQRPAVAAAAKAAFERVKTK